MYYSPSGAVTRVPTGRADLVNRDPRVNAPTYHGIGSPALGHRPMPFTLRSDSPAIDAAVKVGAMGPRDFFGDAIPSGSAYDIGADERCTRRSGTAEASCAVPRRHSWRDLGL